MGGVTRRFPGLHFAFLEGGVAWAAQLYADVLGHYEKRNADVVGMFDPRRFDLDQCAQLLDRFATGRIANRRDRYERNAAKAKAAAPSDTLGFDDFAESQLTDPEQIVDIFTRQFHFGCEADDPLNTLAFDGRLLPHGARLSAMFASDIGHWDVPDIRGVLPEAWELVDDGLLDEDEFRAFTFGNAVRMLTAANPDFFAGTAIAERGHRDDRIAVLTGRVAIVTGGGRGIGRRHCLELARHGARVLVNDPGVGLRGEGDEATAAERPADDVVAEIVAAGGIAVADHSSVTSWDASAAMVARAVDEFGRFDVLVNNAGILRDRMITSMTEEDFDLVLGVHLKGTFSMTKHACDHWRTVGKAGGANSARIVNTTSGAGMYGNVGQAAYAAAKAAIANLTLVTALEMGRYDVTANAISPVAATRMTPNATRREDDRWDPMDPGNSSPVVAYLASEHSGWLTGQVLRVEGNVVRRARTWSLDPGEYVAASGARLDAAELVDGIRRLYGTMPAGLEAPKGLGLS